MVPVSFDVSGMLLLLFQRPLKLELDLLRRAAAFMFDVDNGSRWDGNPLPRHLDLKLLSLLDAVRQTPQFLNKLLSGVILFDITRTFLFWGSHV